MIPSLFFKRWLLSSISVNPYHVSIHTMHLFIPCFHPYNVAEQHLLQDLLWLVMLWYHNSATWYNFGEGTESYLLKSLKTLLQKCNWLSVQQLIFYQSVILACKIVSDKSPYYLALKMSTSHPYHARQGSTGSIQTVFAIRQQSSTTTSQQKSEHLLPCPCSSPNCNIQID